MTVLSQHSQQDRACVVWPFSTRRSDSSFAPADNMRVIAIVLAAAALMSCGPLVSGPRASTATVPNLVEVRSAIAGAMADEHVPAMSVAIYRSNDLIWNKAFGTADIEQQVSAKVSTRFRLGSVSRVLTAGASGLWQRPYRHSTRRKEDR